jgi:hypothetical protein
MVNNNDMVRLIKGYLLVRATLGGSLLIYGRND